MAGDAPIPNDARWAVVSLGSIAKKIGSGATPTGGADAYLSARERFALVRSQNVFDRRFDRSGLAFISDNQAAALRSATLNEDDILLNITGDGVTFGRACLVPPDVLPACVNQHVTIIRVDDRSAIAGYVLAFLTHPHVKAYMESFNAGGSRRAITKGHIESFQLPLPPIEEQRAIAHILGTLDDRIELNRRMNETLEAMARAFFQSCFRRGACEGESGSILGQADLLSGGTPKTDRADYWQGHIKWASAKDVSQCPDLFLVDTERTITERGLDESATQLLPRFATAIVARGATTGRLAMFGDEMAMNQTCYGLVSRMDAPFALYCQVRELVDALVHAAHGSVFDTITTRTFETSETLLPPVDRLKQFDERVRSTFQRILVNVYESRTLAALRDTLLPKLISGEMRVKDAEKMAARAL